MTIGKITYSYTPDTWSQEEFLRLGGFTVVFLNYNKAKFIEKSVASALAQDFPLCEMFFMDDASTDGSGDTMERLVREYRGRHKVTVLRNDENQHICGQWNIVSKLATGNWLGMFCADDEAWPDRVSKAAQIASKYPSLLSFTTGGMSVRVRNGVALPPISMLEVSDWVTTDGTTSLYDIAFTKYPVVGATAWYRKSLFDNPLPRAPLDDFLLRWIVQARAKEVAAPTWLWASDVKTITYTSGVGVSTEMQSDTRPRNRMAQWVHDTQTTRKFDKLLIQTWRAILEYYASFGAPRECVAMARCGLLTNKIICGNTFTRLWHLPAVIKLISDSDLEPVSKKRTLLNWTKITAQEFFGIHVAAFLTLILKRIVAAKI